jgi:hypothetical protein
MVVGAWAACTWQTGYTEVGGTWAAHTLDSLLSLLLVTFRMRRSAQTLPMSLPLALQAMHCSQLLISWHVQSCLELPQVFEKQWFDWSTIHKAVASPFKCKGITDLHCRFCWRHHQSSHVDHPSLLPVTVAWMQQSGHGTEFQCLNLMEFLAFQHNASFVLLRLKGCLSSSYKMMYSRKLSFEHHACLGSKEDSNGGPTSLSCFMAAISCCLLIVLRLQPIVRLLVFTWA